MWGSVIWNEMEFEGTKKKCFIVRMNDHTVHIFLSLTFLSHTYIVKISVFSCLYRRKTMKVTCDLKCQSKSYMKYFIFLPRVMRLFHLNMDCNIPCCPFCWCLFLDLTFFKSEIQLSISVLVSQKTLTISIITFQLKLLGT